MIVLLGFLNYNSLESEQEDTGYLEQNICENCIFNVNFKSTFFKLYFEDPSLIGLRKCVSIPVILLNDLQITYVNGNQYNVMTIVIPTKKTELKQIITSSP